MPLKTDEHPSNPSKKGVFYFAHSINYILELLKVMKCVRKCVAVPGTVYCFYNLSILVVIQNWLCIIMYGAARRL